MAMVKFKTLDIRPLLTRGEEPFGTIRARVDALMPNQGLTVVAPFLPAPLIELLQGEGFQATVEHQVDGTWLVNLWRG